MDCFVIMPIGNPETEPVWEKAYFPIINGVSLKPKRVDIHDDGTFLPMQIIQYISGSQIIIADLTLARPNCYLEVGYAMGLNKYNNLILCCREDHNPDSPIFSKNQHKVHFDLQSFGILWWGNNNLDAFKVNLKQKIERRIKRLKHAPLSVELSGKPKTSNLEHLMSKSQEELKKWKRPT